MRQRLLSLPLSTLAAWLVAGAVAVFLVTALFGLFNPRDTSQPEGAVVAAAVRVARGEPLYLDVHKGPYVTAMYGPLLYLILGWTVRLTGAEIEGAYLAGRLLSLASALLCGWLVSHLARRAGASAAAARIAGGLFVASPLILPVAYSSRSDVPAVALALIGVTLFQRWADSRMRALAAIPLVAAAYTKQTALAAALGIVLSLFLARRVRQGLGFGVAVALPCAAILAILIRATHGLAALNLLEVPGASPMSLVSRPLGGLLNFLTLGALPLILAVLSLPRLAAGDPRLTFPACYAVAALAVSLAASAKLGSDTYYFIEPLAATLILSAVGLTSLLETHPGTLADTPACLAAGAFAILVAASIGTTARSGEYRYRPNDRVIGLAASAPGDVLIEDENVALKCGKPLTMMDPYAFAYLNRRGRWDAGPLNRRILSRQFGAIILRSPIEHPSHYQGEAYWSEGTLAAIGRAYEPEGTVDGYVVYRPRPAAGGLAWGAGSP